MYLTLIYKWDLSTKILHLTRCNMYNLASSLFIDFSTNYIYLSRSQDRWKWAPLITLNSYFTSVLVTPKSCMEVIHAISWLMRGPMKKLSYRGRWNKEYTSPKLIISPNGIWNEDVSLCYHSKKVNNNGASSMVSEQSTNERRVQSSTIYLAFRGI